MDDLLSKRKQLSITLDTLPPEIWELIFSYDTTALDLKNIILTCKYLCQIAKAILWRHPDFKRTIDARSDLSVLGTMQLPIRTLSLSQIELNGMGFDELVEILNTHFSLSAFIVDDFGDSRVSVEQMKMLLALPLSLIETGCLDIRSHSASDWIKFLIENKSAEISITGPFHRMCTMEDLKMLCNLPVVEINAVGFNEFDMTEYDETISKISPPPKYEFYSHCPSVFEKLKRLKKTKITSLTIKFYHQWKELVSVLRENEQNPSLEISYCDMQAEDFAELRGFKIDHLSAHGFVVNFDDTDFDDESGEEVERKVSRICEAVLHVHNAIPIGNVECELEYEWESLLADKLTEACIHVT